MKLIQHIFDLRVVLQHTDPKWVMLIAVSCERRVANLVTRARLERREAFKREVLHRNDFFKPGRETIHLGSGILQPLNSGAASLHVSTRHRLGYEILT